MAKRKIFQVGDLVRYIGHGTEEYLEARSTGMVMKIMGPMVKVKWVSPASPFAGVWYQPRTLEHLEKR